MESQDIKKNVSNAEQWIRILYMFIFGFILYFVMMVMWVVVFIQAIFAVITGSTNEHLQPFSKDLSKYISDMVMFLTYNQESKPFPFSPWGELEPKEDVSANSEEIIIEEVDIVNEDPNAPDTK
jgi:hypothetical protein